MNYYRDLITQKSWSELQKLSKNYRFVLIGGWAVWVYTKKLKSKDIDIVVEFFELERLKNEYQIVKNLRLKKYEAVLSELQIDIYVPHWSALGLPVDTIIGSSVIHEGFCVPPSEILLITKQKAYQGRAGSAKGRKDLIDIFSLLCLPEFNWKKYIEIADKSGIEYKQQLEKLIKTQTDLPELNLNRHQIAKKKKFWLTQLSF